MKKIDTFLKKKEKEFLHLACSQKTYQEIAKIMKKSPRTIDGYRDNLFKKMSVSTRTGMILYALKNKIIKLKDIEI